MIPISKRLVTILVILGCIAAVLGVRFIIHRSTTASAIHVAGTRSKGNPQADLRIVEYIDFQCPSCAVGSKMLSGYFKKYPGRIFLELKYFPLRMHRHGFKSSLYAQCAARQGKFWPFHDLLIDRQGQWKGLVNAQSAFTIMVKDTGLDQKKMDACLGNKEVADVIIKDKTEGQSRRVKSTPTYFINDKMVVGSKSLRKELMAHFGEKDNK